MKFDVIVGNPPYQLNTNGHGAQAKPVYHLFMEGAQQLAPKHIALIIPSRWFSGGMGLDTFRARMVADRRLRTIVDYPVLFEAFPGVEIKGGVCYFHWDSQYNGDCEFVTFSGGEAKSRVTRTKESQFLRRYASAESRLPPEKSHPSTHLAFRRTSRIIRNTAFPAQFPFIFEAQPALSRKAP
jgi:hypothetical protein